MKVILLKDVAKIGRRFDVAEVPDGYARNQLIPKGMAEPASVSNMKKINKLNAAGESNVAKAAESFSKAIESLKESVIKVAVDLNEKNHAFKAVSEADISEAAKSAGIDLDPAMLKIDSPIKEGGEHKVTLHSGTNNAEFVVEVIKK